LPFESLAYRCNLVIPDFPMEWLPLIHLYDPDLPLFPVCYFHVLPEDFPEQGIPDCESRAYGFIEGLRPSDSGLIVSVLCNKDLDEPGNASFRRPVEAEIRGRLGISNPVSLNDLSSAFLSPLDGLNRCLVSLWNRMVPNWFGNFLPFGRFYDPVFGLVRLISTFNPPGGRKGELIQTHYFLSKFGIRISVALDAPRVNFYLLPTLDELRNLRNTLGIFQQFGTLCEATEKFISRRCGTINLRGHLAFTKFKRPSDDEKLNTENFLKWIRELPSSLHEPLIQCFNAFDKGPSRTVLFLLSLYDLRYRMLRPENLTAQDFGLIYSRLGGSYQSPKVLNLYGQQCFGNIFAFPKDTWVETFMKWPLRLSTRPNKLPKLFASTHNLGKVERLLWHAAQARKVHSPLCDDILWCTKVNSARRPRGANPLACCACSSYFRDSCPGYSYIKDKIITFNRSRISTPAIFEIHTSAGNNSTPNQQFNLCEGRIDGEPVHDDFTSVDMPDAFKSFPQPDHQGEDLSVGRFIEIYGR